MSSDITTSIAKLRDEPLLDLAGVLLLAVGGWLVYQGNVEAGAALMSTGVAAIAGPRVVAARFND